MYIYMICRYTALFWKRSSETTVYAIFRHVYRISYDIYYSTYLCIKMYIQVQYFSRYFTKRIIHAYCHTLAFVGYARVINIRSYIIIRRYLHIVQMMYALYDYFVGRYMILLLWLYSKKSQRYSLET